MGATKPKKESAIVLSPAGAKVAARKERKRLGRLSRSVAGEFTKTRHAA